ncbi:MAG: hypothetical protein DWQ01_12235 [Planctomycetota bacterium]|nr:MAG: hypothetical protein DWQ01_12235 [Planctomycetota bacterium]
MHRSLLLVPALLLLPIGAVSGQEIVPPKEGFTTGPPGYSIPAKPGTARTPVSRPRAGASAAPDGSDIQANQDSTSAQNETSFSVNPMDPDNWVGVANDYRFGSVQTGWYTTLDGGQNWTTGTFGIAPGFSFSGDPCVSFDVNGTVHIVAMMYWGPGGSGVWHWTSTDGGLNWTGGFEIDRNSANDKPQVGSDYSNGPHRGDVTTAWDRFGFSSSDIYASTWSAGSWSGPLKVNDSAVDDTIAPDVAYGANSVLYIGWADRGSFDIFVDKSMNGGASYGNDVLVSSYSQVPSPIPGSPFRMFDIFAIAADWTDGPHSGNVYLAYHTWSNSSPSNANIRCATSTNLGASWTTNLVNAADTTQADQVMPGVVVDSKGNVNVSFYDRRLDPNNDLLWTWVARSSDGGQSWQEHPVSDTGWDPSPTEFGGTFIGDYIDVDAYDGLVFPFWCDGRSGSQEVYTDGVNLDFYADVDSLSAATGGSVQLSLRIGPNFGGHDYIVVGSASGTSPGTLTGTGVLVPLNQDAFTALTIAQANSSMFQNTLGTLDAQGAADAVLDTQGPLNPALVGNLYHFATVVDPSAPSMATQPLGILILP